VFYLIISLAQISLNGKPAIQVILLVTSVSASTPLARHGIRQNGAKPCMIGWLHHAQGLSSSQLGANLTADELLKMQMRSRRLEFLQAADNPGKNGTQRDLLDDL
jgi:hypothetical protein